MWLALGVLLVVVPTTLWFRAKRNEEKEKERKAQLELASSEYPDSEPAGPRPK